jgi:uncharacterized membrane protein YhhN
MRKVFIILFIIVSLGELLSLSVGLDNLHQVFKPLIMISLGFYYLVSTRKSDRSLFVFAAIVFSLMGDIFLLFAGELYFMLGLGSFLLAHIFYIISYQRHQWDEKSPLMGLQRIRLSFPIVLAGTGLLVVLYPHLGELVIPVVVYALVLVIMVLNALFRYGRTTRSSFWLVFVGALLFMLSDSLLSINKFMVPVPWAAIWIMTSYIAAQYLIVEGLLRHVD